MKGIIFTEFLDFVEAESGYETVDAILERVKPESGGAYTAVGSYPYSEMAALLGALAERWEKPPPTLLRTFGKHLFHRFSVLYPTFFSNACDPLEFLHGVEGKILAAVVKLYPDAELPSITTKRRGSKVLNLRYRSCRPLGHLCLGLIEGCAEHFNATFEIEASSVSGGLDVTIRRIDQGAGAKQLKTEALP